VGLQQAAVTWLAARRTRSSTRHTRLQPSRGWCLQRGLTAPSSKAQGTAAGAHQVGRIGGGGGGGARRGGAGVRDAAFLQHQGPAEAAGAAAAAGPVAAAGVAVGPAGAGRAGAALQAEQRGGAGRAAAAAAADAAGARGLPLEARQHA
jgi:hypothetical protein